MVETLNYVAKRYPLTSSICLCESNGHFRHEFYHGWRQTPCRKCRPFGWLHLFVKGYSHYFLDLFGGEWTVVHHGNDEIRVKIGSQDLFVGTKTSIEHLLYAVCELK